MKRDKDDWLDQKITEELLAMADEREKELMEMEELQDIDMPIEKFEDIKREAERRRRKSRRGILRPRTAIIAAALLALLLGVGVVTVGSREYRPEIIEREQGTETTTKINNTEDAVASAYDEEEVCQEIEEKLGVLAPRLIYRPEGMELVEYWTNVDEGEAVIKYSYQNSELKIYISKDFHGSTINSELDGVRKDVIFIESNGMEVPVYEYLDSQNSAYYEVSFEYFNTFYWVTGMIEIDEFERIIENIAIKNV